jgi:AraC family transcriptional regulator
MWKRLKNIPGVKSFSKGAMPHQGNQNTYQQIMEQDYIHRINQAIDFIYQNIDQNLTVEDIANHCCFSRFYFNRIFRSVTGESVYGFVKRLKMEIAAFKLRSTRRTITEISLEAGYSPSNFATAFKEYFNMSASTFRKSENVPVKDTYQAVIEHIKTLKKQDNFFEQFDSRVVIRDLDPMILEYHRFIGNYYHGLKEAWEAFCLKMEQKYTLDEQARFIGISYDTPLIADPDHCMYDMCLKVEKKMCTNVHRIDAGTYACYELYDKQENLIKGYQEILSLWVPFSNYNLDDRPCLEIYRSGLDNAGRLHLDICIPVRPL